MKEDSVLYQIRTLENIIIRNFICDNDLEFKKLPKPTPTQMQIMSYILDHNDEEIYQRDLEKVLNLRRATVSGVLQTMEKNKLIIRVIDEMDARSKKIILSDEAKKLFSLKEKKFYEIEKKIKNDISKDELDNFLLVIKKMKNNFRNN